MDVSLSARLIMLTEPVEGFDAVALTGESELINADGGEARLQEIKPGMYVQASGKPGGSSALLARKVFILEAKPTSTSD